MELRAILGLGGQDLKKWKHHPWLGCCAAGLPAVAVRRHTLPSQKPVRYQKSRFPPAPPGGGVAGNWPSVSSGLAWGSVAGWAMLAIGERGGKTALAIPAAPDRARGARLGSLAGDMASTFAAGISRLSSDDMGGVLAWWHGGRAGIRCHCHWPPEWNHSGSW